MRRQKAAPSPGTTHVEQTANLTSASLHPRETVENMLVKGMWAEAARKMQEGVGKSYDELRGSRAKHLAVLFALEHQRLADAPEQRNWNIQALEALENLEAAPGDKTLRNAYRRYLGDLDALEIARRELFRHYRLGDKPK